LLKNSHFIQRKAEVTRPTDEVEALQLITWQAGQRIAPAARGRRQTSSSD
jgi:hypothetical protein